MVTTTTLQIFSKLKMQDAYTLLRDPKEIRRILMWIGIGYLINYTGWTGLGKGVIVGVLIAILLAAYSGDYKKITEDNYPWCNTGAMLVCSSFGVLAYNFIALILAVTIYG